MNLNAAFLTVFALSTLCAGACAHEPTSGPVPETVAASSPQDGPQMTGDEKQARRDAAIRAASLDIFGSAVGSESPRSNDLILDLAAVPKDTRSCETKGSVTTCCGGNTEGVKSDGVCCSFGNWSFSCELVTCQADGHCYDHEGSTK